MSYTLAYKRVSSVDQNTARQLDGLSFDKEFVDHCSGKDIERPQLKQMVSEMRSGDTILVHEISRLARNLTDLLQLIENINGAGVKLKFVKDNITYDSNDKNQKLMLSIMGAVATFEREMIHERQAEGIAKAKAKGSYLGRSKGSYESVEVFTNKASTKAILRYLKMNESISRTAKLSQTSEGSVKKVKKMIKEGLIEL